MKPFRFDGGSGGSGDSMGGALSPSIFESIDPMAGTLLLFPSWLSHSADLHTGDGARISVAFNVKLGQGPPAPQQQQQRGAGDAETEMPIYIPTVQCTADLCG
jgi:hypothetical protein